MDRHIGERHAIKTKDESLWCDFHGQVPRVGETVHIDGKAWSVMRVDWHVSEWRASPRAHDSDTVALSQARVTVESYSA